MPKAKIKMLHDDLPGPDSPESEATRGGDANENFQPGDPPHTFPTRGAGARDHTHPQSTTKITGVTQGSSAFFGKVEKDDDLCVFDRSSGKICLEDERCCMFLFGDPKKIFEENSREKPE